MNERLFTVRQFAERAQLSAGWIYELVKQGKLPAVHIGRSIRIPEAALGQTITKDGTGEIGDGVSQAN